MDKKKYSKISEKITLAMALWLIFITIVATAASFLNISSIVTALMTENLEKYIHIRGDRESQVFSQVEENQKALALRLSSNLKKKTCDKKCFDETFMKFKDGATRDRTDIDNQKHPSFFLPKSLTIDSEVMATSKELYNFLDRECFLSLSSYTDCWAADANGSLGVFLQGDRGYADDLKADFKNLEQVWMTGITPQQDPERKPVWTKTYLDQVLNIWFITLSTPIYVDEKFVGAIGNDISVTQMFERLSKNNLAGTKNFIINSEGILIAHPEFQERIKSSKDLLYVSKLKEIDPTLDESYKVATKNLPFEKPSNNKSVYDLDANYLLAITKLEGPDWYLATLYPKSTITATALKSSRYILIFGCISLILELMLLMRLIKEKLARPLSELIRVVQKVSDGDLEAKVATKTQDEFEILGDAFNEMTYNLGLSRAESQAAIQKANEASQVKSDFVSNISHELRTPLNGILGMTHFLNDTNLSDEQKKYASFIAESGNNLLTIVNQVLDFAKIDAKKYELEEIPFTLNPLLDDVKNIHYFSAKQKGLPIDIENNVANELELRGDAARLRQILSNLVANAIKFSDVGAISVIVSEVGSDLETKKIRFIVKDQGIGISAETQQKLFQPFSQADNSMSRQYGGTGLGLYIVKSFISLMSGTVGVNSVLGQGSEFWFEIPLRVGTAKNEKTAAAPAYVQTLNHVKPILVVEDNFINQVFTEALLKKLGFTSVVAKDGQEAVNMFQPDKFSLILMDCQMPIKDGYQATREIRKKESASIRIPIIALTANTENKDREMCLQSGMDDMLSKPVKVAVFKEKLDYWLMRAQQKRA